MSYWLLQGGDDLRDSSRPRHLLSDLALRALGGARQRVGRQVEARSSTARWSTSTARGGLGTRRAPGSGARARRTPSAACPACPSRYSTSAYGTALHLGPWRTGALVSLGQLGPRAVHGHPDGAWCAALPSGFPSRSTTRRNSVASATSSLFRAARRTAPTACPAPGRSGARYPGAAGVGERDEVEPGVGVVLPVVGLEAQWGGAGSGSRRSWSTSKLRLLRCAAPWRSSSGDSTASRAAAPASTNPSSTTTSTGSSSVGASGSSRYSPAGSSTVTPPPGGARRPFQPPRPSPET